MKISVTSGRGISNRKILIETNKYFGGGNFLGFYQRVIPIANEGFVVIIYPYNVIFNIFNKEKCQQETIKNFLEYVFRGKTIGISINQKCDWIDQLENVNIKYI